MLVGLLLAAGYVAWEAATWPNVPALKSRWPKRTAFITAWERKHDGKPAWRMVPYSRISPHLKRAVLVAEDIDFFSHDGFDLHEVRLAVREAVDSGEAPRGASTLTQQLAKNLWLSPSRNPVRLMVLRNCLGMTWSVSTFTRSRGATRPVSVVKCSIA